MKREREKKTRNKNTNGFWYVGSNRWQYDLYRNNSLERAKIYTKLVVGDVYVG